MSGGWLLRSTLGRREKFKERISPQGRKGVDTQETEEEEVEDGDGSATQLCSLFGVALLMCPALHLISDLHEIALPIVIGTRLSEIVIPLTSYDSAYHPTYRHRRTQPATAKASHRPLQRCGRDSTADRLRQRKTSGRHLRVSETKRDSLHDAE